MAKSISQKNIMPTGTGALFCIQIFSTLSYSVLYSTLILYVTQGMRLNALLATSITGAFLGLNYFLHLLGGYIGGRYLSYRSLFSVAMLLQALGCALISYPDLTIFYWGLAAFLSGSGLNSTCMNCMVMQLFEPEDKRRETAFLWNYSGMNVGFFIGFTVSGYFHLHHAYQSLFLLSGLGNLIALMLLCYHWATLHDRDTVFSVSPIRERQLSRLLGIMSVVILFVGLHHLLKQPAFSNHLILLLGAFTFLIFIGLITKERHVDDRKRMFVFVILSIAAFIFWSLYQLGPMGLMLFIERNVDRNLFGITIAPQWVQNINTIIIILGGPLLSVLFTHLRKRGVDIHIPIQFSLALLLIGCSYIVLPIGIYFANSNGFTNFNWILASYVLQSVGELFIAPIGYAMIGQLAPLHLRGLMMGMWMMLMGVAATLSGKFSQDALGISDSINPLLTNSTFSHTFSWLGISALLAGIILLCLTPLLTYLIPENKKI